jgi:hypothetical protein
MPDGNGTTMNVDLFIRNADTVDRVDGLAGEGLVDFEEIDIVLAQSSALQYFGNSIGGTDTHDAWGNTDHRSENELADDGEAEAFSDGATGEKNGCCSI